MKINIIGGKGVVGNGIFQEIDNVHEISCFGSSSFNNDTLRYEDESMFRCDCLIHAAGVTDEEVKADVDKAMVRATVAVKELIEKCIENGCKNFVYISSVHVYGDIEGLINEKSLPNPKSNYGLCHLFTEAIFKRLSYNSEIKCLILRVPTIYGYPANLEKLNRPTLIPYDFPKQLVMNQMIELKSSGLQNRNFCSNRKVGRIVSKWLQENLVQKTVISNVNGDYSINVRSFSQQCIDEYKKITGKVAKLVYKVAEKEDYHPLLTITAVFDEPENLTLTTFINEYLVYLIKKQNSFDSSSIQVSPSRIAPVFPLDRPDNRRPGAMRIAITGANGFIGRHIIPSLLANGHEVVAIVRNKNKAHMLKESCVVIEHEIGNDDTGLFEKIGSPDALLHLAWGRLPNYRSMHHIEIELPVNYIFIKNLVKSGLKNVSVVGTCFEYGMQTGELSETLETRPDNPYGYAKDALRKQLQFLQNDFSFNLNWLRLFYMYGEDQPENTLYSKLKADINQGETQFKMSGGEQLRDYLHIDEVSNGIISIIQQQKNFGIVNICSGKPTSVRSLVEKWKKDNHWDIKLKLGHFPYPDYEPMAFWGDRSKYLKCVENVS